MSTTTLTSELIPATMQLRWDDAKKNYEDLWLMPKDERFAINEYERALHVLNSWRTDGQKGSPIRFMRSYGVMENVIIEVVAEWCDMKITEEEIIEEVKTEKRADKYDALISWTKDKVGQQYTTDSVVEVAGFSYPTVLKFLQESPHFRKIKKGLWEIRDPKADRDAGV